MIWQVGLDHQGSLILVPPDSFLQIHQILQFCLSDQKRSVIDIGGPPPWSLISASLAIDISYPVLGFAVQIAQFW